MPLAQSLVLAVYLHERRRRRRAASGDARPEQLIKTARDAQIPEHEIQSALELAGRHATETTTGQIKGAVAGEDDLAVARCDTLTADEITSKLPSVSQIDLAKIDSYERKNQNRTTVRSRLTSLRGDEPWAGYDELTVAEVQTFLSEGDEELAKQVRAYERSHKNRRDRLRSETTRHGRFLASRMRQRRRS